MQKNQEEPVVALHVTFLSVHTALGHSAGTGRRHDHLVSWLPVGGQGHSELIRGLQAYEHSLELIKIPAKREGIVDNGADDVLRVDEKNTALTACVALSPGWIMPYLRAMSMVMSSMRGKRTSTFFMPLYSIFS